jgi:hypothetical protein
MRRSERSWALSLIVAVALVTASGCGGIDRAVNSIDSAIEELKKGTKTFAEIKDIVGGTKQNLDKGVYKDQVDDLLGRVSNVAEVGGQAFVDFTRERVIQDLTNLKLFIQGKQPVSRVPVLANAESPKIDFASSSRSTLTVVGWNLDVAQKKGDKYKVVIKNSKEKDRTVDPQHVTFQGQYAVTINTSNSGITLQNNDAKLVFAGFDPVFEIAIVNSAPKAPSPKALALLLHVATTDDDKDPEITFGFLIYQPGVGPISQELRVGGGETWPDHPPTHKDFRIDLLPGRGFEMGDRLKYALRITYYSSHGDPKWEGHISAKVEFDNHEVVDLLADSGRFAMGHIGGHPERKLRDFQFNR